MYADQIRLEHVLANFLSNAIKFSDPRTKIDVLVSYNTHAKDCITFVVKDCGIGMTPDEQKLLFQPFQQIRPGELQKGRGSGLGLSICKMIVNLHHGSLGCHSQKRIQANNPLSGGSEFYFNIHHNEAEVNAKVEEMKEIQQNSCASMSCDIPDEPSQVVENIEDIHLSEVPTAPLPVPTASSEAKLEKLHPIETERTCKQVRSTRSPSNPQCLFKPEHEIIVEVPPLGIASSSFQDLKQIRKRSTFVPKILICDGTHS